MINFVAKFLVLVHTVLSIAGMTWAMWVFFRGTDYAYIEPRKEVLETNPDGTPKAGATVRHASEYDKSVVALTEATKTRDRLYAHVKPALDSIYETEPYLPNNHRHYQAELKKLRESPDKLEVKRLKDGGLMLTIPNGLPESDAEPVKGVSKSYKTYIAELKGLNAEIEKVDEENRKKISETKRFVAELTGTDEANKYVQPGLYQLIDREFKAQLQLRTEIDDIKPNWSKAIEQARLYLFRRADLEATLQKLKGPPPAPKIDKKN